MGILDRIKSAIGMKPKQYAEVQTVNYKQPDTSIPEYGQAFGISKQMQKVSYVPQRKTINVREVVTSTSGDVNIQTDEQRIKEMFAKQKAIENQKRIERIAGKINRRITGVTPSGKPTQSYYRKYGGSLKPTPHRMLVTQRIASVSGTRVPYQGSYYQGKTGKIGRGRPKGSFEGKYAAYGGVFGYRAFMRKQRQLAALKQQGQGQRMVQQNPQLAYQMEVQRRYAESMGQVPPQAQMPQNPQLQAQQQQFTQPSGQVVSPQNFEQVGSFNAFKVNMLNEPAHGTPNPFEVKLGFPTERPVANPTGDYYTEYDWLSGQQVVKRRVQDNMWQW